MAVKSRRAAEKRNEIPLIDPAGGTESLDAPRPSARGSLKRFVRVLGPGLITGASDDDPSGIGTYAIAGASFGFNTLWMALVTFPMMASVQYMYAKIGMVSGRGLAGVLKIHFPRKLVYVSVLGPVVANSINAGADIGAIAAGINLLVPIPVWSLIVPIALAVLALQIWGSYRHTTWQPAAVSAPQAHFLLKFFLMFVCDTSAFRFLQQIRLSDDCTITVNQSEIVGQDPVHHGRVIALDRRLILSIECGHSFLVIAGFRIGIETGGEEKCCSPD